jgi:hypothetical protein
MKTFEEIDAAQSMVGEWLLKAARTESDRAADQELVFVGMLTALSWCSGVGGAGITIDRIMAGEVPVGLDWKQSLIERPKDKSKCDECDNPASCEGPQGKLCDDHCGHAGDGEERCEPIKPGHPRDVVPPKWPHPDWPEECWCTGNSEELTCSTFQRSGGDVDWWAEAIHRRDWLPASEAAHFGYSKRRQLAAANAAKCEEGK